MRCFVSFLLLFVFASVSANQKLYIEHLTIEDGLANNSVRTIVQDQEGYLWFGTLNGLSRYDGQQFKTFDYRLSDSTSISNNKIRDLFQDGAGYIWVTTYDNNVHRFDPKTETFINFPSVLGERGADLSVHFIEESSPGMVWLYLSGNGCVRILSSPDSPEFEATWITKDNGLLSNYLNTIWTDRNGNVWISTTEGISRLTKEQSLSLIPDCSVSLFTDPVLNVMSFCETNDAIWAGMRSGEVFKIENGKPELVWKMLASEVDLRGIRDMQVTKNGDVIVATESGFLFVDGTTHKPHHYTMDNSNLNSNYIMSVYLDQYGDCWLVTNERGVTRFEPSKHKFTHYPLHPEIRQYILEGEKQVFQEDSNGDLWVGIYGGGISRFNRKTELFEQFLHEENNPASLSSNLVLSISQDRSGNLLIGTYKRGVNKINLEQNNFHSIQIETGEEGDFSNEVRSVFEDSRRWIWTGNKRGEVTIFDQDLKKIFKLNELLDDIEITTGVYTFEEDRDHNIWIGTKGNGIFVLKNLSASTFLRSKNIQVVHLTNDSDNPISLTHNDVFDLHQDHLGQMWIGLYHGGVNVIQNPLKDDQRILKYTSNYNDNTTISDNRVRCFMEDHQGNMWIGTSYGLNFVDKKYLATDKKSFLSIERSDANESLSYNDIICICEDSENQIWIGTLGGGVNKLVHFENEGLFSFEKLQQKDGLSSNMILGIVEDENKTLWISTDFGLNKYQLQNKSIEKYYTDDGLNENSFSEGNGMLTSSGKLLFGHISGMIWFVPDSIRKSQKQVPVVLTNLKINGETDKEKLNKARQVLGDTLDPLYLNYNENFITFEFAALDYKAPSKIQYAFKLDDYEPTWNQSGNLNTAIYRELPPGNYLFRLKVSNSDGVWVNPEMKLSFTILAPPWKTTWAYSFYLVFFFGMFFLLQRFVMERVKLKHEIEFEKQLADDKLKFYTSISHEFKTPLALILGPVEDLLSNAKLQPSAVTSLKMVKRNTRRLQELIDQLMDFRKIQKGYLKINNVPGDLVLFLNDIYLTFLPLSKQQRINLLFQHNEKEVKTAFDYKSLEKIVFNLLSNAFKHTGSEKTIKLELQTDWHSKRFTVSVSDEGEGIREKDLPHIFDRFNLGDRSQWKDESSTGIGLSFCSELVELLGGKIIVESKRGEGSCFTVSFPFVEGIKKQWDLPEPLELNYTRRFIDVIDDDEHLVANSKKEMKLKGKEKILIVEDNPDMQVFLANHLSMIYNVIQAFDGQQGLEMARKENPDLVICDIMMPEMDGLELTSILKSEFYTSHIPVILLTARSLEEQKIEGIETGADDYIVKPFNVIYLEKRIHHILKQRKQLRERFRSESDVEIKDLSTSVADQEFMDQVFRIIGENMADTEFTVDKLLEHFNFGRTVFYKKMKGVSGYPPKDFIRIVRMKKAGELLHISNTSVAEVAFKVGYSDPDYFSRIFKKHFGKTPSEYQKAEVK